MAYILRNFCSDCGNGTRSTPTVFVNRISILSIDTDQNMCVISLLGNMFIEVLLETFPFQVIDCGKTPVGPVERPLILLRLADRQKFSNHETTYQMRMQLDPF